MIDTDPAFGQLHPKAPAELALFTFVLGSWRCEARLLTADGSWQSYRAAWHGRVILDGYAIADEYRMFDAAGALIVLGTNLRSYDAAARTWSIRWLNAFTGAWTDLAPAELGGVRVKGASIQYAFKEPVAAHSYTRATYTPHDADHFTWRGDQSSDGESWTEFMVVESYREPA